MKLSTARQGLQKGFTLIELLVVIGILGILAAALIATIDPFEQLEKARDATVENTLVEYQTANIRYYTNRRRFPFGQTGDAGVCPAAGTISASPLDPTLSNCVHLLVEEGELKAAFTTATDSLSSIYLSFDDVNSDLTACYLPTSKSKQRDPNTAFAQDGSPTTGCNSQTGGSTNCYWCVR